MYRGIERFDEWSFSEACGVLFAGNLARRSTNFASGSPVLTLRQADASDIFADADAIGSALHV
jgi:hypothetical protein